MPKLFRSVVLLLGWLVTAAGVIGIADAAVNQYTWGRIARINLEGPYLGIVVPNSFEMSPLLQSPSFVPHSKLPYIDFAGNATLHVQG